MKMNFSKIQIDAIKKLEKNDLDRVMLGKYKEHYGLTLDQVTLVLIPRDWWYLDEVVFSGDRGLVDIERIIKEESSLVEIEKTNRRIADPKIKGMLVVFDNDGREMFVSEKALAYFPKDGCVYKAQPGNQTGLVQIYEDEQLIGVVTPVRPISL